MRLKTTPSEGERRVGCSEECIVLNIPVSVCYSMHLHSLLLGPKTSAQGEKEPASGSVNEHARAAQQRTWPGISCVGSTIRCTSKSPRQVLPAKFESRERLNSVLRWFAGLHALHISQCNIVRDRLALGLDP